MRVRLDRLLVEKGLIQSRARAQAIIMAGKVLVDGKRIEKAGQLIDEASSVEIVEPDHPFVSRGGIKLEAALTHFCIDCQGKVALDIGASTGGFTDCLLQHGIKRVYALDVGRGQLDWRLRNDTRVINLEKINVRYMPDNLIPEPVDIVTIDCSFISIKLILSRIGIMTIVPEGASIIGLIKPQFEVGKGEVEKGGVVKDPGKHERVLMEILAYASTTGLSVRGLISSPIKGPKGNREFLLYMIKGGIAINEMDERDSNFLELIMKVV